MNTTAQHIIIRMQGLLIARLCAGACTAARLDAAQALRQDLAGLAGELSGRADEQVAAWLVQALATLEGERA